MVKIEKKPKPSPTPSPQDSGQDSSVTTDAQKKLDAENARLKAQAKARTGKGTSSSTSFSITPKETAYSELDREMIALFGRRATGAEKSAYFKALNTAEKYYKTTSSGETTSKTNDLGIETGSTSTSTSTNNLFEKDSFLFEFTAGLATNYVKAGKTLGGKAGVTYDKLKAYASNMGVAYDEKSVLKDTLKVMNGSSDEEGLKQGMRKRAISLYGGLSESLQRDPTLTVKEAAGDYIQIMSNMLDINQNSISLLDPTLSKALNASKDGKPYSMNLNEFTSALRDDSRFKFSTMAHQEARDLASSFASAFGFGG